MGAFFGVFYSACMTVTAKETTAPGHEYKDGKCTVCGAADPDYIPPKTEEKPPVSDDNPPVTSPETGDIAICTAILAMLAIGTTAVFSKKRRTN